MQMQLKILTTHRKLALLTSYLMIVTPESSGDIEESYLLIFFIMIVVIFNLMIWFIPWRKKEYNDTLMLVTQSGDFIYLVRILLGPFITYISIYILHQFEGL